MKNLVKFFALVVIMSSGLVAYSGAGSGNCYLTVFCDDGGSISCSGTETCESTTANGGTVTCDGKSTQCDPVKKGEQ